MSFFDYLRETRGELKHVSWPSRRETLVFTLVVISLSVAVAYFLGFFDYLFRAGLEVLIAE